MRTVTAPVPPQTKSHSSQRPAGVVGSRNLGREQKGHLSPGISFQLPIETWRCCFGRCICLVVFDSCSWTVLSLSLFNFFLRQSLHHSAKGLLFP